MRAEKGPAHSLLGITLSDGWLLSTKLTPGAESTGGHFGVGYIGERGSERAFIKAIDFVGALESDDPLQELAKLTSVANFERDALAFCGERRMSRVVRLISHEYVNPHKSTNPLDRVSCLVMEIGDGDLRKQLSVENALPCSFLLSVLRDVALAVDQLHRGGVAHQDIKPSNVIAMDAIEVGCTVDVKLTDLGRVVRKNVVGPFDSLHWPGDGQYMPPERWYGYRPQDWSDAREASDAFMLGSLLFFLFTGVPLQPLLLEKVPDQFQPDKWRGDFDDTVVGVLRAAQAEVIVESLEPLLPPTLVDPVVSIARDLTEPDPHQRGDKRARQMVGRPVGMDRFHQRLRALSLRAAILEKVNGK